MEDKVIKELYLYRLREIEIEDMKLKIEELEIGDELGAMNYEERVQTSMKCKNNDYIMNQIDTLKKKIRLNEILNKRIDNSFKRLSEKEKKIITKVYINKTSLTKAAKEFGKTRKTIKNVLNGAVSKIELI